MPPSTDYPPTNHPVEDKIRAKLTSSFRPLLLEISNESADHQGHRHNMTAMAETAPGEIAETHFRIKMISQDFSGMKNQERHRAVYHVLAHELRHGVHALALETRAPGE